jgi:hypothetical protein
MTILWSNNASTTVSGSITPTATSVALAAGTGVEFPSPTGGDYFCATFYDQATKTINEIVHVTARSGDVCTIVRAQEGTVAGTWNAGDIFANLVTAGTLRAFVQAGVGPANTSLVYVGTDVSTTPGLIVCNTNPVPSSLAVGMLFNIWVKNTNPGPVNLQLNGGASIAATRANGAAMVGGDCTASEEMMFVYNGVNFNTMIPNILNHPPQTTFYVRTDGNDNNTGYANTPTDAFATTYGAINAIRSRYTSQDQITIRVADGSYIGGFGTSGGYIGSWNIIGNVSNPGNVTIDATSLSPPAGSIGGSAVASSSGAVITVSGMTFKGYYDNVVSGEGATLLVHDCHFTGSRSGSGSAVVSLENAITEIWGTCQYDPNGYNSAACFAASSGGFVVVAYHDAYQNYPLNWSFVGAVPAFASGTASANSGGLVQIDATNTAWSGNVPSGYKYVAQTGGGVFAMSGSINTFPGTVAGIVTSPGWLA